MFAEAKESASLARLEVSRIVHTPTITTLYALIEALQNEVAPEDDATVTAAVTHLFNAGYVKLLNVSSDRAMTYMHENPVVGSNRALCQEPSLFRSVPARASTPHDGR